MLTKEREAEIRADIAAKLESWHECFDPQCQVCPEKRRWRDLLAELDETRERVARLEEFISEIRDEVRTTCSSEAYGSIQVIGEMIDNLAKETGQL